MNLYLIDSLGRYWCKIGYPAFNIWMNKHPEIILAIWGITPKF